jgi:hypothetical protein
MNIETKKYTDGTLATGVDPLPELSPKQQDAENTGNKYTDAVLKLEEMVQMVQTHGTEPRLDRLIDHVNRELGVAQEVPLVMRLAALEAECAKNFGKIKEKTRLLDSNDLATPPLKG